MVVLKELTQILGLFRQPPAQYAEPDAGPADRPRCSTSWWNSAHRFGRRRTSSWPMRSATSLAAWASSWKTGPTARPGGSSRHYHEIGSDRDESNAGSTARDRPSATWRDPIRSATEGPSMATTAREPRAGRIDPASRPGGRDRPRPERDRLRGGRAVGPGAVRRRGGGDPASGREGVDGTAARA